MEREAKKAREAYEAAKDEVDFVATPHIGSSSNKNNNNNNNNNNIIILTDKSNGNGMLNGKCNGTVLHSNNKTNGGGEGGSSSSEKKPKERLSLFGFGKRLSQKAHLGIGLDKDRKDRTKHSAQPEVEKPQSVPSSPRPLTATATPVPIGTPPRAIKFVKNSPISRLFGHTYNAKKFEREEQKRLERDGKYNTFGGRRRSGGAYLERFRRSKEDGDVASSAPAKDEKCANGGAGATAANCRADGAGDGGPTTMDFRDSSEGGRVRILASASAEEAHSEDLGAKAFRTLSRGLGKLRWKRTHSVDISSPDPEFKVSYLGNVLTGWAKGEGCVEKQLNTLWRNYTQNNKPDVIMRIKVCASGLKATTRQHGLTEYWANRITHCCAPKNYPRVFCWIYRHEGRKLKHELRCHAVLCSKEKIVHDICETLKANLECALREFKREKILKQNARLSLANAVYDNPSLPRRKILLSVGGNNYRPPLERSKSAPKLMSIEEAIGEEDGDEVEDTNEPEMRACCQKDSLYPAMTLGRRRCRRGHSIRRTGKLRPPCSATQATPKQRLEAANCCGATPETKEVPEPVGGGGVVVGGVAVEEEGQRRNSYGSNDSDDFEKLLKYNNYDTNASLANELLPYFDMKLHKQTSSSLGSLTDLKDHEDEDGGPLSLSHLPITINSDPSANPQADYDPSQTEETGQNEDENENENEETEVEEEEVEREDERRPSTGLRRSGVCSDGEEDYLGDDDDLYFRQAALLNMLHRSSMRKMVNLSMSSDEGSSSLETSSSSTPPEHSCNHHFHQHHHHHQGQSSISSDASSTAASPAEPVAAPRKQMIATDSADEGSISSGCETASTATANQDDVSLQYQHQTEVLPMSLVAIHGRLGEVASEELAVSAEEIFERLQRRNNSDAATTFSSSSSITLKMGSSPTNSLTGFNVGTESAGTENASSTNASTLRHRTCRQREFVTGADSDSECSDESGYVEYLERDKNPRAATVQREQEKVGLVKPLIPPKPMPRRLLSVGTVTAV